MAPVMIELLPLIIGPAASPVWIIIVLLLLRGEGGLAKALGFVGGLTAVRLAQGVVFGYIFGSAAESGGDDEAGAIVSTVLLVIGIVMWIAAIKQFRKEDDPDAPPPNWMAMIGSAGPLKAFGFGALLVVVGAKYWVFTLGALGVISESPLAPTERVIAFLLYVLLAQSLLILPIVAYAVAPGKVGAPLETAGQWLERHNRVIVIAVSVIFGSYFLWKGISGLIG